MSLQQEIDARAREIKTDGYSMSIGELLNLYSDGDIDIHPEFQRIFRWTSRQKSRLVESIFLGIPVPPIFVAQRQDGIWDVVDGVQRLSTIIEFTGRMRGPDGPVAPEPLERTDYLPSLEGKRWGEDTEEGANTLTDEQRRYFKRSKVDFIIVKKESDPNARYDLFERLNSGTGLSDQEVRNCVAVMLDSSYYRWLAELAEYESYRNCMALTTRKEDEGYGIECVLRYFAGLLTPPSALREIKDVGEFLNSRMREFISDESFDRDAEAARFRQTFDVLDATLGEDTFRRFDPTREKHVGAFSISAFEVVAVGVGNNVSRWAPSISESSLRDDLADRIRRIWFNPVLSERAGAGKRATQRMPALVEFGTQFFGR